MDARATGICSGALPVKKFEYTESQRWVNHSYGRSVFSGTIQGQTIVKTLQPVTFVNFRSARSDFRGLGKVKYFLCQYNEYEVEQTEDSEHEEQVFDTFQYQEQQVQYQYHQSSNEF